MLSRSFRMRTFQLTLGVVGGAMLTLVLLGGLGLFGRSTQIDSTQRAFVMAQTSSGDRPHQPDQPEPAQPATPDAEDHTTVTAKKFSRAGYDVTPLPRDEVERLAKRLDAETYRITQKAGTEPAFCGTLLDNKKDGVYTCVVCGLPLFTSEHKFTSGTGWPSFYTTFDREHVVGKEDTTLGMSRVEIECARCTSHLGHVFDDGPEPTGLRFCLNSASLVFYENGQERPPQSMPIETETAYFAGGCFWGIEHYYQKGEGVINAVSGFMQGDIENPTYEQVCANEFGFVEAVMVVFDPQTISYERLLEAFFVMHDPTQLNRQGPDVGSQYRSGIYTTSDAQQAAAVAMVQRLEAEGRFARPIVTEIEPAETFYEAEAYHQDYIETTGRACHVKNPW
ncbi:MAG: bifunctional methionine sulfoxide reductase B/A protein [Planctomycetota bacterium]|nr:bifunctional methionine sulfoxide reductase B/A protein [Planctomycetota bacterium]